MYIYIDSFQKVNYRRITAYGYLHYYVYTFVYMHIYSLNSYEYVSVAAKAILPANFEDTLILIFLSSVDLELMKNARSPKIWAP